MKILSLTCSLLLCVSKIKCNRINNTPTSSSAAAATATDEKLIDIRDKLQSKKKTKQIS